MNQGNPRSGGHAGDNRVWGAAHPRTIYCSKCQLLAGAYSNVVDAGRCRKAHAQATTWELKELWASPRRNPEVDTTACSITSLQSTRSGTIALCSFGSDHSDSGLSRPSCSCGKCELDASEGDQTI